MSGKRHKNRIIVYLICMIGGITHIGDASPLWTPSTTPQVPHEGDRVAYRLLYSSWLSDWVQRLDPGAPDELYILARGEYDTCTA